MDHVAAAIDDLAIIIAAEGDRIAAWNLGAQRLFGYHECEMIGRTMADIECPVVESSDTEVSAYFPDERDSIEKERCYRHKSGRRVCCRSRLVSLNGTRVWLVRDASPEREQRRVFEQRLREQQAKLEQALVADGAKDRCLAMMSHELKQPLTALLLNLERLLEKTADLDVQGALIHGDAMRGSIRRQARIIDDLHDLSRMRTGKLRLDLAMVDLDEIVRSIASDVAIGAPDRELRVDVDVSARRWCMADPVRLEQMLSNLLNNAVKFSGHGGRIAVRVAGIDGFATVSIADDGCGISAEFLPHVFRMFGQERRVEPVGHPGMGIGLALVQELAKAHGGGVDVQSKGAGCGALFTVWLPVLSPASGSRSATLRSAVAPLPMSTNNSMEMRASMLADRMAVRSHVV
ncbi:ATP-binding protein [Rhodanobacter sp. Col0626]|uniref:PAS domain-containing sensor histidine kinase n=1 Tax=Rhodanobacter sp. Col0626 TaxID=3415679 RepID=UPI003CF4A84A